MSKWEQRTLRGALPASALSALGTVSTAVSAAKNINNAVATAATTSLPLIVGSALDIGATAIRAGADTIVDTMNVGLYSLLVYPRKVDVARARYTEEIAILKQRKAALEAQRAPREFRRGFEEGRRMALATASVDEFGFPETDDIDEQLSENFENNSLEDAIRQVDARIRERQRQIKFLADPGLELYFPYSSFVNLVEQSFYDTADSRRPTFSTATLVGGAVVMVSADKIYEFAKVLQSLATILRVPKLARQASMYTNFFVHRRLDTGLRAAAGAFPDWNSWTLSRALGLDKELQDIRKAAYSLGGPVLFPAKLAANIAKVNAAMEQSLSALSEALELINQLANADVGVHVLPIPPVDGTKVINVFGQQYNVPNGTYGNEGFLRIMKETPNFPKGNYVAGLVILIPSPVPGLASIIPGMDALSSFDTETLLGRIRSGGDLTQFINLVQGQATYIESQLAIIRGLTNAC